MNLLHKLRKKNTKVSNQAMIRQLKLEINDHQFYKNAFDTAIFMGKADLCSCLLSLVKTYFEYKNLCRDDKETEIFNIQYSI